MKQLFIIMLVFLLPTTIAEMSHSPKELSAGEEFTAWIDAEDDVKSITFYVCTLEEPYTCYKPETVKRNDTVNGRFQFTYEVKNNDYPGYKYELEKNVNLVRFEKNRIEISFNDNLDKNFVKDLSLKLFEWTHQRLIITFSKKKGEISIKDKEKNKKNELIKNY